MKTFEQYDNENPSIWEAFKKYTKKAIEKGFDHYSSKTIFELIRWHESTSAVGGEFKINNNYTSQYARKFMKRFPKYDGFFRTRTVKNDQL